MPNNLKPISAHSYRTPPTSGEDYYSVGAMNLIMQEVEVFKNFCNMMQRARDNPDISSITVPITGKLRPSLTTTGEFTENVRPLRSVSGPAPFDRVVIDNITRVGNGVPNDQEGFDGDTYMNSYEGTLYERINGAYLLRGSIMQREFDASSNSFKVSLAKEEKPRPAAKQKRKIGGRFSGLDLDGN